MGARSSAVGGGARHEADRVIDPIVLNDNGAWSWFEDERAVVDITAGKLLVSSVASADGTGGETRAGNVEVVAYDLVTGRVERAVLHPHLQADDHNSAALYVRPDGRYVAMYSKHATDHLTRWRVSSRPGDAADWAPEATLDNGAPTTYSNVYPADRDGTLYAFVRVAGRDPHVLVSVDHGTTWRQGGRLLDGPGRPYVRSAARGSGRIHLVTTDQHPRDFPNRIYHGAVAAHELLRSDGTVADEDVFDSVAVPPDRLTEVFHGAPPDRAWTVDLHVDEDDHPYTVFSVGTMPDPTTGHRAELADLHRFYVARFDGAAWSVGFLAYAGNALYRDEPLLHRLGRLASPRPMARVRLDRRPPAHRHPSDQRRRRPAAPRAVRRRSRRRTSPSPRPLWRRRWTGLDDVRRRSRATGAPRRQRRLPPRSGPSHNRVGASPSRSR